MGNDYRGLSTGLLLCPQPLLHASLPTASQLPFSLGAPKCLVWSSATCQALSYALSMHLFIKTNLEGRNSYSHFQMRNQISKSGFEGTQLVRVGAGDRGLALYPWWT